MPNKLPLKSRAKAVRVDEDIEPATVRAGQHAGSIDWLSVWAISLGVCAVIIASIAYFTVGDNRGAAFVLTGTAAMIALILQASTRTNLS